ncbi:MAG: hypothetical protein ACK6D5_16660, partial [Planctomyces sp.]
LIRTYLTSARTFFTVATDAPGTNHPTVRWKGGRHLARFKHHGSSPDPRFDLFEPAGERRNSGHQKEKAVRLFRRTASFEDKSGRVRFV